MRRQSGCFGCKESCACANSRAKGLPQPRSAAWSRLASSYAIHAGFISLPTRHSTPTTVWQKLQSAVVCLVSALAYHELTEQLLRAVWMPVGTRDWRPKAHVPRMRIERFSDALLTDDVITVEVKKVPVRVFGVAKTIADCFRHRRKVGQSVASEGLREPLWQRNATPAEIARHAKRGKVATIVRPYLEAFTANA